LRRRAHAPRVVRDRRRIAGSSAPVTSPVEGAWFCPLCDDDYEYLGVPDPRLRTSFPHCPALVLRAERNGFDNILCPSGYALGIDSVAFAGGVAPLPSRPRPPGGLPRGGACPPPPRRENG